MANILDKAISTPSVQVIYFCATNHPNLFCSWIQWVRNSDRVAQMAHSSPSWEVSNDTVTA